MKLRKEELALARAHTQITPFEGLTKEQLKSIMDCGRGFHRWFKEHQDLHIFISLAVIMFLFVADFFVLIWFPRVFMIPGKDNNYGLIFISSILVGCLHGWLMYSLIVFSLHEGAAHKLIFPPRGPITKLLNSIANNLCRISSADPVYYAKNHLSHHAKFGTEEDGEFLNFVLPHRFWMTLIPYAMIINFSDFIVHRPLTYSRSRIRSEYLTLLYNGIYAYFMINLFGVIFTLLSLVFIYPHLAFYLDRLRQFSEHNLMPIENRDGARSFGPGFWGILIGGGPWGQPCHWMHHLVPSIPWYQQIALHFKVVNLLSQQQRRQYLLQPLVGYPRLLWRLWKEPNSFARSFVVEADNKTVS
jgi:hypothetical protein